MLREGGSENKEADEDMSSYLHRLYTFGFIANSWTFI